MADFKFDIFGHRFCPKPETGASIPARCNALGYRIDKINTSPKRAPHKSSERYFHNMAMVRPHRAMVASFPLNPARCTGLVWKRPFGANTKKEGIRQVFLTLAILLLFPLSPLANELPDIPDWARSELYETQQANKEAIPEDELFEPVPEDDAAKEAADDVKSSDESFKSKDLPGGGTGKSGVSPQALSLPDGPGSSQGMGESFTPNLNTGGGSFSVPIAIPPGRRGVQPNIGLGYSTGAGDGVLGWGWNIGVPFITRQSDKGLPQYNDSDRFIYNGGTELVSIAMPTDDEEWPAGWVNGKDGTILYFRSRLEGTFMRFFYNKTNDTWLVQDKQGNHYYFGEYQTEKIVGPKGTYQWNLTRMADIRNALGIGGNDVRYAYIADGNNLYFSDIYWNSFENEYGALENYQHRVHFRYELRPDPSTRFTAGFKIEQRLRLAGIEVSSFQDKPKGQRTPTRTYLFSYADSSESFHSKLMKVQMCGRDFQWNSNLGGGTGTCMPPLTFSYTRTQNLNDTPGNPINGFGTVNELVQTFDVSPDVAIDDPDVSLIDINQDGLPDVFITRPEEEYFGAEHAAILNDPSGNGRLEDTIQVDNPAGWSLRLSNLNVQIMDVDGTGNADLLHMPYAQKYHYYRLTDQCSGSEYCWNETADIPLNPDIDFTNDSSNIQMTDLNSDGLIDIVRTAGTRMEHFMNLSATRDPTTEKYMLGQFGRFDSNGYGIANESVNTCVLMRGGPIQFAGGNVRMGDMNGDGLLDIVDLKSGSIAYWPNRGFGQWGDTTKECKAGEYVDGTEVEMTGSPYFSNPDFEGVSIADVNGDGLSDLVQIRFDAVDIWLNRGDNTFTPRHIIDNTPPTPSGSLGQVTLADINGSGTVDIVWGNAGNWQYIDLGGDYRLSRDMSLEVDNQGIRPGLMEVVENGLGGATILQYDVSTHLMMQAEANGNPWDTNAPMPLTVVTKSISRDYLEQLGGPKGRYVSEYVYANPYYDAHEAEFRGFSYAESWDRERDADGDGRWDQASLCNATAIVRGEAPIVGRNWFHTGTRPECMPRPDQNEDWNNSWGPHSVACAEKLHDDNPLAGLNGASIKSDVYSPCTGKVVEATVSQIEVRKLFGSNNPHDIRGVYFVTPNQGRVYKYNPDAAQGGGEYDEYQSVKVVGAAYPSINGDYVPAAALGNYHLIWGTTKINDHGDPKESFYGGFKRLSGDSAYEYADCDQYTEVYTTTHNKSTWVHSGTDSYIIGATSESGNGQCDNTCSAANPCRQVHKAYLPDGSGDMWYSQFSYRDVDGTGSSLIANYKMYNSFGQVTHNYAGCGSPSPDSCERHSENVYGSVDVQSGKSPGYSAYIVKEISYKGTDPFFVTTARWDAGLAQITHTTDINGTEAAVEYDALGRFAASYGPILSGKSAGQLCGSEPLKTVDYVYGYFESGVPMSTIVTTVNTSQIRCEDNPWDRFPPDMGIPDGGGGILGRTEISKTFIDSLGRTYATVVSGDNHLGGESKFPYVINGDVDVNAKGAAYATYEGTALQKMPGSPEEVVGRLGRINPSTQQFDACGRPTVSVAPDHTMAKVEYGLDWAHSYDHLDMSSDPLHSGTYSTQRVDGLGRTVLSISRYKSATDGTGSIIEKWSVPTFDAMGNVVVATQFERMGGASAVFNKIARRAKYDTLGRIRFNTAVTFGTWEYKYDHLGQMKYARNQMGDEFRYDYDQVGRIITESSRHHNSTEWTMDAAYFYDSYPNPGVLNADLLYPFTNITGITDASYPEYATMRGQLVASWDASGISVVAADRGLFGESWRMVFPDESTVYHSESLSDYAGQLVYAENDGNVRTTASYYGDGTAKSSFVSYRVAGKRIDNPITVVKKSYANILGQTELVQYGDAGNTVVWNGYDPVMHRRKATVVQSNTGTLMAFGYRYNQIGLLEGIGDFRGRNASKAGTVAPHPASVKNSAVGYHFPTLASASSQYALDSAMTAPTMFANNGTQTLWPIGAAPSDAEFTYDSRYQLVGEDRDYITSGGGDDWADASDVNSKRLRSVHWDFDTRGNMTSWKEEGDSANDVAVKNLGRALGETILNGWQLNQSTGKADCMYDWTETDSAPSKGCYIPDALYFASNIGPGGPVGGKGTCVWASYDSMGRMVSQTVRTGCSKCSYNNGKPDGDAIACTDPEATRTDYMYTWDARSRLVGAEKTGDGASDENIVMSYLYDISGNRVIREKSNVAGGAMTDIYQDIYVGGTERRHVQLQDQNDTVRSIATEVLAWDVLTFENVEDTRELHYAAGARIEYDNESLGNGIAFNAPKIFLSFDNHLGSTSTVIDYETGKLVEWNTHYAYGADESRWKNPDSKYDNAEEPYGFTGKEEDKAVGLHYFGSRYYSSYLGRWLSPDPPVIHGGGLGNHYNYGGNSPYIFIDPDGNSITALIVGAVVGAVVSATTTAIKGGSAKDVLLAALKGGIAGAITGGAGALNAGLGVAASAAFAMGDTAAHGGGIRDVMLSGAISAVSGAIGAGMGGLGAGVKGVGAAFGCKALSYVSGLATAYGAAALTGGVTDENWDDILKDYSVNFAVSSVARGIAQKAIAKRAGMGDLIHRQDIESDDFMLSSQDAQQATRLNADHEIYDLKIDAVWNVKESRWMKSTELIGKNATSVTGREMMVYMWEASKAGTAQAHELSMAIAKHMDSGKVVAFLNEGDPSHGAMVNDSYQIPLLKDSRLQFIAEGHTHPFNDKSMGDQPTMASGHLGDRDAAWKAEALLHKYNKSSDPKNYLHFIIASPTLENEGIMGNVGLAAYKYDAFKIDYSAIDLYENSKGKH
ncbi:MAG: VCBS repeat-containing protein [Deltaproteobacteria bacterium]|nr:VCBS repeat-containing protein [Deltaproteobacteria bacterium]